MKKKGKFGEFFSIEVIISLIVLIVFVSGFFIPYGKYPTAINIPEFQKEKEFYWFFCYHKHDGEPRWVKGKIIYSGISDDYALITTLWKGGKVTVPEGLTYIDIRAYEKLEVIKKPEDMLLYNRAILWSWKWEKITYNDKILQEVHKIFNQIVELSRSGGSGGGPGGAGGGN